ncbi:MAG: heparinase, partial [Proteobacteria bacterium]|nr:heparinase [Pseudomonadota bacterium]
GLIREIEQQFCDDGGHFELSPMYHGIMVEDLLDVLAIQSTYSSVLTNKQDNDLNSLIRDRMPLMLRWLIESIHPDGDYVLLNDAAMGIASQPQAIVEFAKRCGIEPTSIRTPVAHQRQTGHIRVTHGDLALYVDTGEVGASFQPGHAHADSLTFECSLFGKRFIVDTGTSEYAAGPTRTFQRSTAAHNTVEVDHTNSSEVWGAFRVARRARPGKTSVTESETAICIKASHDGYRKIIKGPIHQRVWSILERKLAITDTLTGPFGTAVSRFHLHPEVQWQILDDHNVKLTTAETTVQFNCTGGKIDVLPATYSPEFGLTIPNSVIVVSFETASIEQTFSW